MAKKKIAKKVVPNKKVATKKKATVAVDTPPPVEEPIEGLDDDDDGGLGDYPIDTLLIRKETRTVYEVVRRIENNAFVMDPDFQREFVWAPEKKSKLIESVLMRIPLPVFYLAEDADGNAIVVDGLQRLSTFRDYLGNKFRLKLPKQEGLNKKRFEDLSPKLQNRIEDCNLELYIIDEKVPEQAKLDIFDRVNSGEPLSRQQMRNCLYMGQASRWLRQESESDLFLEATGKSLSSKTMRDREFVNRFCAFFVLGVEQYKGDMDEYLATALRDMNESESGQLEDLSESFRIGLQNNFDLFERHAFRKHTPEQDQRSILNASLWDVMSTGLARYSEEIVTENSDELKSAFYELLEDEEFNDAITYGPNSSKKVKIRFEMADEMFKEVLGDY